MEPGARRRPGAAGVGRAPRAEARPGARRGAMVVQGAQTMGLSAGMNCGAFWGAAGLPESFDQYRPPAQVRARA